ncbi:hypothetical protein MaudMau93_002651 [Microsporum audouinii]
MDSSPTETAPSCIEDETTLAYMSPSFTVVSEAFSGSQPASNGPAPQKPKQSKSRNGCVTCKSKRLKCDETKPTCLQCRKRNVPCGGYKKDFKWRSFEESSFTGKPKPKVKKHDTEGPGSLRQQRSLATKGCSGHFVNVNPDNIPYKLPRPTSVLPPSRHRDSKFEAQVVPFLGNLETRGNGSRRGRAGGSSTGSSNGGALSESPGISTPDFTSESQSIKSNYHSPPVRCEDNDFDEEIARQDVSEATDRNRKHQCPLPTTPQMPSMPLPAQVGFHADSAEMLLLRFDRRTCGILSVKDGRTENPWRTAVAPLVRESPALYHAVCALAAFHSTKENTTYRYLGMDHMRQSIRTLAVNIESMETDAAIATTLALAFADTWDRHVSTGVEHLRGAKALFNRAVARQRHTPLSQQDQARLMFLYNSWMYIAVIAQLTSPEDTGFDEIPFPPTFTPRIHEVDPLMGCATTLFPLIGRVAVLAQKVRKTASNSVATISQAMELKTLIEQWTPPTYFEPPEDPTSGLQHCLQTAQAYRLATLLHLHQAVPEIASEPAGELAKRILILLATVPMTSRTIVIQIFPLLVASCEIVDEEDRNWVRDRWAAMQQRMAIGNVDRCFEVVCEVWRRRDAHNVAMLGRQPDQYPLTFDPPGVGTCGLHDSVMEPLIFGETLVQGEQDSCDILTDEVINNITPMPLIEPFQNITTPSPPTIPSPFGSPNLGVNNVDYSKTVRGKSHWLSVMRDWGWEGLYFMPCSSESLFNANRPVFE